MRSEQNRDPAADSPGTGRPSLSRQAPAEVPDSAALHRTRPSASPQALDEDWDIARNQGIGPLSHAGLVTEGPDSIVLGGFKIVRKIGLGGFGAVYLAEDQQRARQVALKVLARSKAVRVDYVQRFIREARTLERLDHPNIVRGCIHGEEQGWHYFAMEYIDGDSLFRWLQRLGRLAVADTLHIALKVADALQYVHQRQLVHRDIKPENILLTRDGRVKLADLGLAKELDEDLSLTRTGTGFGTPYYMAPEQARNAKYVDHRSDIYSLGTTLYHCLTGRLPCRGETALEIILSKEQDPYVPMRKYQRDIPERVDLIVAKMLARKPAERYQSCRELIEDIERLGLASPSLHFVHREADEEPDTLNSEEAERTREIQVAFHARPGTDLPTERTPQVRPPDHWWYIRHRNRKGEVVTELLTTAQIRGLLEDPSFDLDAQVCDEPHGEFRPLIGFREFQDVFRRVQDARAKTRLESRNTQLKQVYSKVHDEIVQRELRREEARKQSQISDDERLVQEGLESLKKLWDQVPLEKVREAADKHVEKVRELAADSEGRRKLVRYGVTAAAVVGVLVLARIVYGLVSWLIS